MVTETLQAYKHRHILSVLELAIHFSNSFSVCNLWFTPSNFRLRKTHNSPLQDDGHSALWI